MIRTMSSRLSPFPMPEPVRSTMLRNMPDTLPPTDELESLQQELTLLKQKTMERAKKARQDLKTIEESMRRMKEKEKGKSRAIDKVKRERDFTPSLDGDESRLNGVHLSKPRGSPHPNNLGPSSSRSSLDSRSVEDFKKKKKKRKRDDESDAESDRPRKSPPPIPTLHVPTKIQKSSSLTGPYPKIVGPEFAVPAPHPLVPLRPPIPPPPIPGPSKPTDIQEDFSKAKQPTQVAAQTFYAHVEPWLRPFTEEDLGFLEVNGDEVEPYVIPKIGRHYLDIWTEQDAKGISNTLEIPEDALPSAFKAPEPKWDPSTLNDQDILTEDKGHGLLTERVISALLPMEDHTWKGVKAAEDAMEGRPGGSGAAASKKEKMNVSDLETRIRDTMRYHGLLQDIPTFLEKVDDPVATALRHAQDELRQVIALNKARKMRLSVIVKDRIAYQEYVDGRDAIDRTINALYAKLQKKDAPKGKKLKKSKPGESVNGDSGIAPLPPCAAALGLGPDEDNHLVVNEQLKEWVERRKEWVTRVGSIFLRMDEENPGRIFGMPSKSIYQGIEEDAKLILAGQLDFPSHDHRPAGPSKSKFTNNDAMDTT